jgi:hypothetical protein
LVNKTPIGIVKMNMIYSRVTKVKARHENLQIVLSKPHLFFFFTHKRLYKHEFKIYMYTLVNF